MEGLVLVIDDEADVRALLARQLTRLGCECETATDGQEGLERIRQKDFDLVLTDLCMPRLDGVSFLRALALENRDTVAVVLSGHANVEKTVEAMKCGAFTVVEKQGDIQTLQEVVAQARTHRSVKQRAREMTELASQWQATFDAVPDLIAVVDENGRLVRINRSLASRMGCTPDDAVGQPSQTWMRVEGCCPGNDPCAEGLPEGVACVAKVYDSVLGGHFLVSASPLRNAQGRPVGSVCVARDISALERVEEQLRTAHSETENLLASMYSFLIGVDENRNVTRWNGMAQKTFGLTAEEVLGHRFDDLPINWDWDYVRRQAPVWLQAKAPVRLPELRYVAPGNVRGILDITANPVHNSAGQVSGFFLLGTDVTERKNLESQLVHAQKLESIGQLAAGIAHEINTPTQYVGDNARFLQTAFSDLSRLLLAYGELLEWARARDRDGDLVGKLEETARDIDLDYLIAEVPKAIEESLHGVDRVACIVRAMKEFSHPGTAEKTPIDLNRAIESTITVARNEWKYVADMETDFAKDLPMVSCLPGEFNQVILNMIINAAHAIETVVGDGSEMRGRISVSTRRDEDWAEIRITDTGSGIPDGVRERIFDPFFTTKEVGKGTGQGLAIAHNVIVDKHGGTIALQTEVGKGTTFVVRLPIGGGEVAS